MKHETSVFCLYSKLVSKILVSFYHRINEHILLQDKQDITFHKALYCRCYVREKQ